MFFKQKINYDNKEWNIIACSVAGKSHKNKKPPIPCQDSHYVLKLNNSWGIAIVSDGLGSKPLSHIGSKFVSKITAKVFKNLIIQNNLIETKKLPSKQEWEKLATKKLYKIYKLTKAYAKLKKYKLSDLACTVIVVIYSPYGLLLTHIGDGRAGYCTLKGEWKSMMKPINGENSNQVMPITANFWGNKTMINTYIESNIIQEPVKAFTLMSDGCEFFSYKTVQFNKKTKRYYDVNLPYPDFFNPVLNYFSKKLKDGVSINKLQQEWQEFLENGNKVIADEPDDKTMIFAF